ncbi:hypothetical protein ABLN64_14075, partial [Mycobacterium tuberculosis]
MTVRVGDPELVLDPYDYDFHEDPYPYYRRLRDEAPLYRNEERNFWAVSRHHDVLQGFRDSTALSNAYGVSLDPSSRTSEAYRVMSMLAMDDPAHLQEAAHEKRESVFTINAKTHTSMEVVLVKHPNLITERSTRR